MKWVFDYSEFWFTCLKFDEQEGYKYMQRRMKLIEKRMTSGSGFVLKRFSSRAGFVCVERNSLISFEASWNCSL